MNPRIDVRGARLRLLLLLCPFCLVRLASAQNPQSTQSPSPTQSSSTIAALPASKAPISKALPKTLDASPTPSWPPSDVDEAVPPVESNRACVLPQVLSRAAHRIEELVRDLDRFSATEIVQHQKVDHAGHLHEPETNRFDYLVSLSRRSGGFLNVEEYRKARTGKDRFPDHVATEGTPSLVLLFHPRYASNFSFNCEGLGEWRGKPAWQVRFEQRDIRRSMIAMVMEDHTYNVKIRGRAWIMADSYEVARLETDLAQTIPSIHLRLDHQSVEYGPVRFPKSKVEIWLPSSTELFMDFQGHRFYRRHTFTDFNLFSVKIDQEISDPPGYNAE